MTVYKTYHVFNSKGKEVKASSAFEAAKKAAGAGWSVDERPMFRLAKTLFEYMNNSASDCLFYHCRQGEEGAQSEIIVALAPSEGEF